jgi:hypothetical protein
MKDGTGSADLRLRLTQFELVVVEIADVLSLVEDVVLTLLEVDEVFEELELVTVIVDVLELYELVI